MAQIKGKRESKSRARGIRRRVLIALAVVVLLCVGGWAALNIWIAPPKVPLTPLTELGGQAIIPPGEADLEAEAVPPEQWEAEVPESVQSGQREGVYTFLVVGQDTVGGLTDTILLATYDVKTKTLHGMSIPRDTMVNVRSSSKKINSVFNANKGSDKATQTEKGIAALKREVSKLTGIIPNFYVLVRWEAVGELVDALGGVWFEVPFDMNYDDPYQNLHIHQKAGYRKLTGSDAMQVVRHRKNNDGSHSQGDVGRIAVQQDFLKAVAKQCLQPSVLLKAPALAQVFLNNVETDLKLGNLLYFAQSATGMDAEEGVTLSTMPYTDARYPTTSMVLPIRSKLLELLNDGLNPYRSAIKSSDLQLIYRNSDGSYSVTSGTLADSSLARPYSSGSSGSADRSDSTSSGEDSARQTVPETETPTGAGQSKDAAPEQTAQGGAAETAEPGERPDGTAQGAGASTGDTDFSVPDDLLPADPDALPPFLVPTEDGVAGGQMSGGGESRESGESGESGGQDMPDAPPEAAAPEVPEQSAEPAGDAAPPQPSAPVQGAESTPAFPQPEPVLPDPEPAPEPAPEPEPAPAPEPEPEPAPNPDVPVTD